MKNVKLFFLALLVALLIVSCSDEDDNNPTIITCKILSEMNEYGNDSRYSEYIYDTISGNLVKINYSEISTSDIRQYDTLIYNNSGQLTVIHEFSPGEINANSTTNYTFTSGKITKIKETGMRWDDEINQEVPYISTAEITYSGNDLSTITISGDGENMGFKNITFSNGNLNTVDVDFFGNDSVWVGIEARSFDTKNNLEKHLVPDWNNIFFGSSNNNFHLLVMMDVLHMGEDVIDVGDTLFNRTYTYNINDQVETVTSHPSAMEERTSIGTYNWECKEN